MSFFPSSPNYLTIRVPEFSMRRGGGGGGGEREREESSLFFFFCLFFFFFFFVCCFIEHHFLCSSLEKQLYVFFSLSSKLSYHQSP